MPTKTCPKCGSEEVYKIPGKGYYCRKCYHEWK